MGYRLTRIYTRTGDDGSTGLADGRRVPKGAPRVEAIGAVDELNAVLGVLRAESLPAAIDVELAAVQHALFDLGGELATAGGVPLDGGAVAWLEAAIDRHNAALPPLEEFILPAGGRAGALAHLARTVCRRAERAVARLAEAEPVAGHVLGYLNRLSDYLFVVARVLVRAGGGEEVRWVRGGALGPG